MFRARALGAAAGLCVAVIAVVAPAAPASAHPLGNFTVNQYAGLVVAPDALHVELVIDFAEIPTYQLRGDVDTDGDGRVSPSEATAWAAAKCAGLLGGLHVTVDHRTEPLALRTSDATNQPGQAGLLTTRLECQLDAGLRGHARHEIAFTNGNYSDRIGWREITAVGDGAVLTGNTVPAVSVSHELTALGSPGTELEFAL